MLTPFTVDNEVDYESLGRLTRWYLDNGADCLFAVCQSSEMQFLSLNERVSIAKFVVAEVAGRVPVIASGHISESEADQERELLAMAQTGIDALVLVTNRFDPDQQGEATFRRRLEACLAHLPADLPLGLYECPAPYRRLLTDDELAFCRDTNRFAFLKDVSCDLEIITRRLEIVRGSRIAIINANAAIAHKAFRAGSRGFCGVSNNIYPDLYAWLYRHPDSELAPELANFLTISGLYETFGYPGIAKLYQQRLGNINNIVSRVAPGDIREQRWAVDDVVDALLESATHFSRLLEAAQK